MNRDPNLSIALSDEVTEGGAPVSATITFKPEMHPASSRIDHTGPAGAVRKLIIPFRTRRNGPGMTNEALLELVAMRLGAFQAGPYPCEQNRSAMAYIVKAIQALEDRASSNEEVPS